MHQDNFLHLYLDPDTRIMIDHARTKAMDTLLDSNA